MSPYRLFNQGRFRSDSIRYRNLLSGNISVSSLRILFGAISFPFINAWAWSDTTGFGTAASAPASGLTDQVFDIDQTSSVIFVANKSSPYLHAYSWLGGFEQKYSNPATSPAGIQSTSVNYNKISPSIVISSYSSPFVEAYPWSNATGFGSKYSNPSTLPTGQAWESKFNNAGNVVGVGHEISPYISFYAWSSGFGTRFSNPASLPETLTNEAGIGFSPSDDAVVVAYGSFTSPNVAAYPWSNSTGFGTRYSAPATAVGYLSSDVKFSPNGSYVSISSTQNGASVYAWSSGFGTKVANATSHYNNVKQSSFNSNGSVIAIAHQLAPFISAYPWSNSTGFGTKFADPAVGASGQGGTVSFA